MEKKPNKPLNQLRKYTETPAGEEAPDETPQALILKA
jgi:hypothetical protein